MWNNASSCVPVTLYLWEVKFEFHIIFRCDVILFFFNPLEDVQTHSLLSGATMTGRGLIGTPGYSFPMPD